MYVIPNLLWQAIISPLLNMNLISPQKPQLKVQGIWMLKAGCLQYRYWHAKEKRWAPDQYILSRRDLFELRWLCEIVLAYVNSILTMWHVGYGQTHTSELPSPEKSACRELLAMRRVTCRFYCERLLNHTVTCYDITNSSILLWTKEIL